MIIPSLKGEAYSILELNYNPAIFFHANPYQGTPRDPCGDLLDLLGFKNH